MRLADYVIERLEQAGIAHAFTVCGGGSIFLNDALRKASRMRYVCTHHEQAAAIAAEAYARARNGLGLCVVTSGPGGTNAITGCASAWQDHVPVVFLSGQVFSRQTVGTRNLPPRTLGVQEIDIVPMVKSITKYAVMVTDPKSMGMHLATALREATSGRRGPVWLDIPADVQNAQCYGDYVAFTVAKTSVEIADISRVMALLTHAKRPLIHVGQGVRLAGAIPDLFRFLGNAKIPLLTARNANDIVDSTHPLYIGRPGTFAQRGANFAVQTCDLYLAIGTRLSLAQTGYNAADYARNAQIIHVDIDAAELHKGTTRTALRVQCDAREFLAELNAASAGIKWPDWSEWLARCKALQAKYPPVTEAQKSCAEGPYINSYGLIDLLSEVATPDDIVVTDVGYAYQNCHQAWRIKRGQRLLSSNGLAPMGWGLPAAVGAAVGTGRRVICMTGDGGLMFNAQELATIAHHKLPVKIFLLNNGGYLTMRQSQAHAFDGYMGSDAGSGISFPNFEQLAAAHGIGYVKCYDPLAMDGQVRAVLHRDDPVLCEVMMDPEQPQIPKSVNKRLADGTIQQTAIEDAHPYLPAEEIAEGLRV